MLSGLEDGPVGAIGGQHRVQSQEEQQGREPKGGSVEQLLVSGDPGGRAVPRPAGQHRVGERGDQEPEEGAGEDDDRVCGALVVV